MSIFALIAAALTLTLFVVQYTSVAIAMIRCRKVRKPASPATQPPVTIVRPLCGVESFSAETISASFAIDWPQYEIIFCVADAADPVAALARAEIARHPSFPAQVLVGVERLGSNPKLNNMAKGFRAARHDIVVFTDSNLLVGSDYLNRLMAAWRPDVGVVTAPAFGDRPQGFWALVECAMLNSYQARIQYAVDTLGSGFAQGKSLMYRRADLERGGLETLALEPAEDAATTKMMRARGLDIAVAGPPFAQPLGRRTAKQVWARHARWARLRRASFPWLFVPEILAGGAPAFVASLVAAYSLDMDLLSASLAFAILWYAPEALLTRVAGWPMTPTLPLASLVRDAMLPALYIAAFAGRSVEWTGNRVELDSTPLASRRPQWMRRLLSTYRRF